MSRTSKPLSSGLNSLFSDVASLMYATRGSGYTLGGNCLGVTYDNLRSKSLVEVTTLSIGGGQVVADSKKHRQYLREDSFRDCQLRCSMRPKTGERVPR